MDPVAGVGEHMHVQARVADGFEFCEQLRGPARLSTGAQQMHVEARRRFAQRWPAVGGKIGGEQPFDDLQVKAPAQAVRPLDDVGGHPLGDRLRLAARQELPHHVGSLGQRLRYPAQRLKNLQYTARCGVIPLAQMRLGVQGPDLPQLGPEIAWLRAGELQGDLAAKGMANNGRWLYVKVSAEGRQIAHTGLDAVGRRRAGRVAVAAEIDKKPLPIRQLGGKLLGHAAQVARGTEDAVQQHAGVGRWQGRSEQEVGRKPRDRQGQARRQRAAAARIAKLSARVAGEAWTRGE